MPSNSEIVSIVAAETASSLDNAFTPLKYWKDTAYPNDPFNLSHTRTKKWQSPKKKPLVFKPK